MSLLKEMVRTLLARALAARLRQRSRPLPEIDGVTLIVAPHPDDETLGCGGLIARQAAAGRRVHVLFVTDGEASHRGHPSVLPETIGGLRREEGVNALHALGVENPRSAATFLGVRDGTLDALDDEERSGVVEVLARWIRANAPEVICAPFRGGGSSEHDAATGLVEDALRLGGGGALLEYPVWAWWNPLRLRARLRRGADNLRLTSPGLAETKARAIACHRTQVQPMPPWPRAVLPAAIIRSCTAGEEFYFRRHVTPAQGAAVRLAA